MSNATDVTTRPDTETALYIGAAVSCGIALMPYVNVVILPSYVIGALAAVWFAISIRRQPLTLKGEAKLSFFSSLLGSCVAGVIFDIVWQFSITNFGNTRTRR